MNKTTSLLLLMFVISACTESKSDKQLKPDEILITYQAIQDDQGSCRPTYEAITKNNDDGLPANKIYMIEGKTEYFLTDNSKVGSIPFQIKMEKETISSLNEVVACKDLHIKVTVEKCKYEFGTNRKGCPPIVIKGKEKFGGIEFIFD